MSTHSVAKLLIVDDEAAQMKALCNTLENEGYAPTGFTSANKGLAVLREQEFDLVLTDLMMPEMDGIALLRAALEIDDNLVGVVMTGQGTIDTAVEAMKAGALDYILKPFKLSSILPVLSRALAVRRLRMENIQLRETVGIHELSMAVASGLDFDTILQKVADAAIQQTQASEVSILLPTREGKELRVAVARGQNAERIQGRRVPISDALSGWVAHSRELLSKPDDLTDVHHVFAPPLREITSGISIPMLTGGRLVGILNFTSARPQRHIALGQVKALNILASAAASALEGASLLDQLRAAEQRYRRLAENAPDIVFRYELHPRRRFDYVSPAVAAVTGYSPEECYADPDLPFRIVRPEDQQRLETIFKGDFSSGGAVTLQCVHKNGTLIWIEQRSMSVQDAAGQLVAIEGIARDITERKNLEEQFRQAQKMEAVGQLAGGVAHDFNNLLTAIIGYSDILLNGLGESDPMRPDIFEIKKAGERAATLTSQLLAFSRKQVLQPKVLDLNEAVADMEKILRRLIGEDIDLVTCPDPALGRVKADPGGIEQIILNLAVNARDAMPEGGKLTIETANVELDESYARGHVTVQPGPYVMLAVSDNGIGMTPETQAHIFEPFFTTKGAGKGTGLGLSTIYGIVKQSGGNIWVYSELGGGTAFKIYLPLVEEALTPVEVSTPEDASRQGSETILLVEDDEVIRKLVYMILLEHGYTVLVTCNGSEALEISEQHPDPIHLMLTDVVMPQLTVRELTESLARMRPETRVLYVSGYTDDAIVHHGVLGEGMNFMPKPFTVDALLRKVREVLDKPQAGWETRFGPPPGFDGLAQNPEQTSPW
jgi:PAS domain S-box-containing protein